MNSIDYTIEEMEASPLALSKKHRSHILFVLSNSLSEKNSDFLDWYKGDYLQAMAKLDMVVSAQHFEQHEVDVTMGNYPPPEFQYLGMYELSLDGADEAKDIIRKITDSHKMEKMSYPPATWLYYPICEKVGRSAKAISPMVTIAFANSTPGSEAEFREWYCTRHIRHALNLTGFASGQCFELTNFQKPGSANPTYNTIALYEQEGTPQEFLNFLASLPEDRAVELTKILKFPTLDATRFGECFYRPITEKIPSNNE